MILERDDAFTERKRAVLVGGMRSSCFRDGGTCGVQLHSRILTLPALIFRKLPETTWIMLSLSLRCSDPVL